MKLMEECPYCKWIEPSLKKQCGHPQGPGMCFANRCDRYESAKSLMEKLAEL